MKYILKQTGLVVASLVMVLGLAAMPVSAEHGTGSDDSSPNGTSATDTGGETGGTGSSSKAETETTGSTDSNSGQHRGQLQTEAKQLLQDKRKDIKEHTTAQRQKACVQRQKSIDKRTANYGAAAQRHLDTFNKIFTRVQAFQASKKLDVSNYDALVATATAKQTAAQTAVDALKALNVQIDCSQADPGSSVATIKTSVSDARTALQAYRAALKDLIVALKGASTAQDSTTGGTQ